jgi:hypothetical protein
MPFALDSNPSPSEVSDAINYLLSNISAGIPADANAVSNNTTTGFISNTVGDIIQYQYRYLDIKYADNPAGLNFSDNPFGRLYFGVRNDDTISESINPADYTWFAVDGGFGISKVLWVAVTGGRHVNYAVSASVIDDNPNWQVAPNQSIDLDNPFATFKQYMTVRYATSPVGTGFSTSPTNATFYGVYTSDDGTSSETPTDYQWSPFAFGTTYQLYYRSFGGRNIAFEPSTYQPIGYIPVTNNVINLDVPTAGVVNEIGIISQVPLVIQGPYRYLLVRYADDINGAGLTNNPSGKTYFGVQASDVLTIDSNPADYTWFAAGETFITGVNLWVRTASGSIAQFSLTLDAPDSTGWLDVTGITTTSNPHIDLYERSGSLVTDISSPTAGRIGYSVVGTTGIINLNLDPYGQGKDTNGYTINPLSVSTIEIDQFGRVVKANTLDQIRFSSMLTHATAGQTAFTFSNTQPNQILVFRNGLFLQPTTDFTRTTTTVTLTAACALNDVIAMYYIRLIDATTSAEKVPFVTTLITLTSGQTYVPSTYPDGSELLFLNGVLLVDTDYTYYGTNQGYVLKTPATGGLFTIVSFAYNNGNALIFSENYTETTTGTTNIVYPTPFFRNSSLNWFNGCLLRPGTDYTVPGSGTLSYNFTSVGFASYSGQPVQFASFASSGEASTSSLSSAGVLGMDMPVEIKREKTILEMFQDMQKQINSLKKQVKTLKGKQ